jgi:hypothetical protein
MFVKLDEIEKAVECLMSEGGFQYSLEEGLAQNDTGYSVALSKEYEEATPAIIRYKKSAIVEKILKYIAAHENELSKGNRYLGAWINPVNSVLYLDISQVIVSHSLAVNLSKLRDQIAFFSNKTKEVIFIKQG